MPPSIEALTREILRSPAKIALQRRAAPAEGVVQSVYPVPESRKRALLVELLKRGDLKEALVFTRTKHRADQLARLLNRNGISAERIHGNRSQNQRTKALAGFKDGKFQVLVATDVAARGIDVEALGHVVNFNVPTVPEDYIHRVGRTARADATGEAFTLVAPEEEANLERIERIVGSKLPRIRLEGFSYEVSADPPRGRRPEASRAKQIDNRDRGSANGPKSSRDESGAGGGRPRRRRFGRGPGRR